MKRWVLVGLLVSIASFGCERSSRPRLVVVIVVDQMRADYVARFAADTETGLRRFVEEGTRFDGAAFAHAMTGTAPGHATIATGADPRVHGIFEKEWFDRNQYRPVGCVQDTATTTVGGAREMEGYSPRQMLVSTLGDWLKDASPRSKVFSVALKARAAIALGGHRADAVYWFSRDNPRFVTSDYYQDALPNWVTTFNSRQTIFQFQGRSWDLLKPASSYVGSREDEFASEFDGVRTKFPHDFHADPDETSDSAYVHQLCYSPFGDSLTLQFARALLEQEQLGRDGACDLLFVGLSSADFVGHLYGPWSQEVNDYYLRLDTYLGELLTWLDDNVGRGGYLAVLTSDHGVAMLPEEARRRNLDAGRVIHADYASDMADVFRACQEELQLEESPVSYTCHEGAYLNYDVAAAAGIDAARLEAVARRHLGRLAYVERVFTRSELEAEPGGDDDLRDAFRRSYVAGRAPDVMLLFRENWVIDTYAGGTDHGTPYPYDSRVPLIFLGPGWPTAVVRDPVDMVDVAPTLAAVLQVPAPPTLRGRDLATLVR